MKKIIAAMYCIGKYRTHIDVPDNYPEDAASIYKAVADNAKNCPIDSDIEWIGPAEPEVDPEDFNCGFYTITPIMNKEEEK